ncbi:MAG: histidine phosphatase family protein [Acidobacteriota bacterium]
MKTLYLLRHGVAERTAGGRDQDRSLTAEGMAELRSTLQKAKGDEALPVWIVSSPYRRARQTAEIAASVFACRNEIVESAKLTPESDPEELWSEVRDWLDEGPVLVVAHEPLVSAASSWMVGASRVMIEFTPGTMVQIDFDAVGAEPKGVLRQIWR